MKDKFENLEPVLYSEISDWLHLDKGLSISDDTMRPIVRRIPNLKTVKGKPKDLQRIHASTEEIDTYFENLKNIFLTNIIPPHFLYCVDEAVRLLHQDCHEVCVVVP